MCCCFCNFWPLYTNGRKHHWCILSHVHTQWLQLRLVLVACELTVPVLNSSPNQTSSQLISLRSGCFQGWGQLNNIYNHICKIKSLSSFELSYCLLHECGKISSERFIQPVQDSTCTVMICCLVTTFQRMYVEFQKPA